MSEGFVDPYSVVPEGMRVVLPEAHELQVDLDTEADYAHLTAMLEMCSRNGVVFVILRNAPSASGLPHRHIALQAYRALTPVTRVAWQAAFGSDRKREMLSLIAITRELPYAPTVFFEPVEAVCV